MVKGIIILGWCVAIGLICVVLTISLGTCNTAVKMVQNGQQTVYDQYKPSELLKKYEWFKDAAAQLDSKLATLQAEDSASADLSNQYKGIPRNQWTREDAAQYSQWKAERVGLLGSYNNLCAEYNAAMVKFNYAFCNKGSMPAGTTEPLPREYKPYKSN